MSHPNSDPHASHAPLNHSYTAPDASHGHAHAHGHAHVYHRAHPIQTHPIGQVRVYLKPGDQQQQTGLLKRLFGRRLAEDIVVSAKSAGLPHAVVLHTRFGYTGGGPIASDHPEYGIHRLPICVELMGEPPAVEAFCRDHAHLLLGRRVVFRHAEQWEMMVAPPKPDGAGEETAAIA